MVLRNELLQAGKPDLFARGDTPVRLAAASTATLVGAGVPVGAATAGALLGSFAGTTESGRYNVIVSASGSAGGNRFVRKEMMSVFAK